MWGSCQVVFIVTRYEFLFVLHLSWAKGRNDARLWDLGQGPDAVLADYAVWCIWQSSHGQDPVPCLRTFNNLANGWVL